MIINTAEDVTFFHAVVYGSVLANAAVALSALRFVSRAYKRWRNHLTELIARQNIMWEDYGKRKYPQSGAVEQSKLLSLELKKYAGYE